MNKNIKLLRLSSLFMGMSFFTPILSLYFLSKGVGIAQVVLAQTLYSIMIVVAEVPTGAIADKFGHKLSVILGCVLGALAYLVYLFFPTFLFVGYGLSGVADSLISGSNEALTHISSEKGTYRKNWSSIIASSVYATAVGATVAGVAYWRFGDKAFAPLIMCGFTANIIASFLTSLVGKSEGDGIRVVSDTKFIEIVNSALTQIRKNSTLRNLAYVQMLTLSAQYVLYAAYQPYFQSNKVPAIFMGLVLSIGAITNGKSIKLVAKFEKILSLDRAVLIFPLLMSATYFIFSFSHNPWWLVIIFIFLQAQFNLLDPMISDYVNQEAQPETRATVISGISFIRSIANALSKFLLGLTISGFGVVGMFRAQGIYLAVGGLTSWWLLRRCGCVYKINVGTH